MGVLDNALNGTWDAYVSKTEVQDWGEACAKLIACHSSVADKLEAIEWVKGNFIVGVDSGQAGIFDVSKFRIPDADAEGNESDNADSDWYFACCDITEAMKMLVCWMAASFLVPDLEMEPMQRTMPSTGKIRSWELRLFSLRTQSYKNGTRATA